ncbi:FeoA family protein [Rosettibacter firmus]|uniref:FeoA family protein n=1 Tax=Rosettibacter firmus TaxID=3111522 RepID=UPI00336C2E57
MTLDKAKKGNRVTIVNLPPGKLKAQFIRLGISEGDSVLCSERLPGGTIVVKKNRQEIAIGYDLAKKIKIILE